MASSLPDRSTAPLMSVPVVAAPGLDLVQPCQPESCGHRPREDLCDVRHRWRVTIAASWPLPNVVARG